MVRNSFVVRVLLLLFIILQHHKGHMAFCHLLIANSKPWYYM